MQHENVDLFFAVVDVSYYLFPQETAGNTELVGLMLQVMDPKNVAILLLLYFPCQQD